MPPLPKSCPDLPGRVRFNSERVGVRMKSALLLGAGALLAVSGTAASAETLQEALANAYRTNPSLTGARAGLRALDEGVPQAKALGRPTFSVTTGLNQSFKGIGRLDSGGRALSVDGDVNVPVFQGGRVRSAIKAAESRIEAGRSDLRSVEAQTFVDVVAAYLEVIRAQRVVELNDSQVRVLSTNLQATRDRFEVGDLTRTDVAQSEARLAGAQSSLTAAQGALTVAREAYLRVVGNLPKDLAPPTLLPTLPQSADEAVGVALENNPDILSAKATEAAARHTVQSAKAERLPTLSATVGASYDNYLHTLDDAVGLPGAPVDNIQKSSRAGLSVRVPLYQGGLVGSRVRQARAQESQAMEQVILTERFVVNQARAAFANLETARAVKQSSEAAVAANKLALEGVRAENSVGTRDVLDVLNAEQELLNSEVALVTAQRDEYVAGFALLAAVGRAEARDLGLDGGALYDPTANYRRVRNSISDWSTGDAPKPVATRTVGPPAE